MFNSYNYHYIAIIIVFITHTYYVYHHYYYLMHFKQTNGVQMTTAHPPIKETLPSLAEMIEAVKK